MFLGWYDPDRRKSLERKLDDALERYREKFHAEPVTVLTNLADAEPLQQAAEQRNLLLKGVRFVPGSTFYVGSEEESGRVVPRAEPEPGPEPSQTPEPAPTKSRRRKRQP